MNEPRPNFSHAMPAAEPQEAGLSPAGLAKLTAIMQREVDAKRLPGVSMLIARRGKIGYRRDLGALRPSGPAMPGNAIFRVYSMTKPIVSTALMMLVEDGRLFIADPVAKYIPEFADPKVGVEKDGKLELVAAKRPITIQDLLRHTSGLTYGFTGNAAVQRLYLEARIGDFNVPSAEMVAALAKLPLLQQPGTSWDYSHSTDVVGRIVEVVSGQSLGHIPAGENLRAARHERHRLLHHAGQVRAPGRAVRQGPRHRRGGEAPQRREPRRNSKWAAAASSRPWTTTRASCRCSIAGGTLDGAPHPRRQDDRLHGRRPSRAERAHRHPYLLAPGYGFGLGFGVRRDAGMAPTPGTPGEYYWAALPARLSGSRRRRN